MPRKLFVLMTMSMDGFVAGTDNELDWMLRRPDQELNDDTLAFISGADTGVMGYPAAKGMIPYWAGIEKDENASQADRALAQVINKQHAVILSNTEVEPEFDNAEVMVVKNDLDLINGIVALKQKPGKEISVPGGVRTGQKLARLGLVDEYIFLVHPVALGSGRALFETKTDLELISAKMYASGVVRLRYQPCQSASS